MHNVSLALAGYLRSQGGEIRTGAGVEKILVESGRAAGVRLESGEEIPAGRLVASGVDPGELTLKFLGEEVVGREVAGKMERYEWGTPPSSSTRTWTVPWSTKRGRMPAPPPTST
jgi:beta-carotene ketolase (CrtO type)